MIVKTKVVSAEEMSRVEKIAFSQGHSELGFMEKAGASIAAITEEFIRSIRVEKKVALFVGKGNNGGDAFTVGIFLLNKGFSVEAFHIYPIEECSSLCKRQAEEFKIAGGKISYQLDVEKLSKNSVILDGLVGTGFHGRAEGVLAKGILVANQSKIPILAIDIPSGLSGTTGKVETIAIEAKATIYLECAKTGFFLEQGWSHVGDLIQGTFGLPAIYKDQMHADAFLIEGEGLSSLLVQSTRTQNKYKRGYVLVVAGSASMMGAGILSSEAVLCSGAGIVRWFHPPHLEDLTVSSLPEVIKCPLNSIEELFQEMKRAGALVIGPGMGRTKEAFETIKTVLQKCTIPIVIDADALFFLSENPDFPIPKQAILTPHTGEMKRLLQAHKIEGDVLSSCQAFVDKKKVVVLLKGAPNFLFAPDAVPCVLPFGNPGMATAGSGDVLSGILGARLSQKMEPNQAALLGSYLHGIAGNLAAEDKTLFCVTASDLLKYLPKAFSFLLNRQ